MAQVQDIIKCPECGNEAVYEFDCRSREDWAACLSPQCDWGFETFRNPRTGEYDRFEMKPKILAFPVSELRPMDEFPGFLDTPSTKGDDDRPSGKEPADDLVRHQATGPHEEAQVDKATL